MYSTFNQLIFLIFVHTVKKKKNFVLCISGEIALKITIIVIDYIYSYVHNCSLQLFTRALYKKKAME